MRLSKVELFGFKSFASKLDLRFDNGITAVVGPNGCGKTNVVDAIRWVLGEQRPRFLRGGRMEDVIFNGSEAREPLGMAEVSLTLENTDGVLPIEYDEVTITRRLFRSGESDYLINKTPCRLMDIDNLLMDTGVGPHSYSVIEQGMVEDIISENPADRRRLFEEAAGITKYKARRRAARQRLEAVEGDLLRLGDIIGEVEKQVESLARQVRKAERHQAYQAQVRDLEIQAARYRFWTLHTRAQPLLDEQGALRAQVEEAGATLRKAEADHERRRLELVNVEQDLSTKTERIRERERLLHRRQEEIAVMGERIESLRDVARRAREEAARTQERMERNREERRQVVEEEQETSRVLSERRARCQQHQQELEVLLREVEEKRRTLEEHRRRALALFDLHMRKSGEEERKKSQRDGAQIRRTELITERRNLQSELEGIQRRRKEIEEELEVVKEQLTGYQTERECLVSELQAQEERLRLLNRRKDGIEAERRALESQLEFWRRMQESYEGYSDGVRALLLESSMEEEIRGVLGNLLDVEGEMADAIESALGSTVQALIVRNAQTVEKALTFLENEGPSGGRTAFICLDRMPPVRECPPLPQGPGIHGRVVDFIQCDEDIRPVVEFLFRDTLMVDTLHTALRLWAEETYPWNTVTLNGERTSFWGEIGTGRSGESGKSLLGRRRQIAHLEDEMGDRTAELDRIAEETASALEIIERLSNQRASQDAKIEELGRSLLHLDQERTQRAFEERRLRERSETIGDEQRQVEESIARLEKDIVAGRQELLSLGAEKSELDRRITQEEEALHAEEERRRVRAEEVHRLRVEMASLEEKAGSLQRDVARLSRLEEDYASVMRRHEQEAQNAEAKSEELQRSRTAHQEELQKLTEELQKLEHLRKELDERRVVLQMDTARLSEEIRATRRTYEEVRSRLYELDGQISELRMEAKNLWERMKERHRVDIERTGPLRDEAGALVEVDVEGVEREVQRLQKRIEGMGPVNLMALEEYQKEKERYEFLTKQRDDLLEAEETLKQTIVEINRRARKQFIDTFIQVRQNFQKTFIRFFGGGEADLILEEQEDPLESEIQIVARPHGKRLQNINLLSGGEKALAAIALLFAIYQVKPSPFCILDEVDAPLDDANIGRFVEVLRQFAADTQFIIITHNRYTMEGADRLYGITMEEPGISQLVSVELGRDA